jgi:hypothetical protein
MVKNTKGGSGQKKIARKHNNGSSSPHMNKTRFSTDPLEMYALCMKVLGGGIFEVLCQDNVTRLCMIAKKFSGRGKRDNYVGVGIYLLVGKREYESRKSTKERCDLLEVYNSDDVLRLEQNTHECWRLFKSNLPNKEDRPVEDDGIDFYDEKTLEYESIMDTTSTTIGITENETTSEIDLDDI